MSNNSLIILERALRGLQPNEAIRVISHIRNTEPVLEIFYDRDHDHVRFMTHTDTRVESDIDSIDNIIRTTYPIVSIRKIIPGVDGLSQIQLYGHGDNIPRRIPITRRQRTQ